MPRTLAPHQKLTYDFYKKSPLIFDMSEAGTQKTFAHLSALAARPNSRALILCPKAIIYPVWVQELCHTPTLTHVVLDSYTLTRPIPDRSIYLTNLDKVVYLLKHYNDKQYAFLRTLDTLIVDESTAFKHRHSQRSKALAALTRLIPFKYKILMSGTPSPKSITELFHQVYLLDHGRRLGTSFYNFQSQVCDPVPNGFATTWRDKPNIGPVVHALIKDITIRHEFDKVMDIPPNTQRVIYHELPKKLRDRYDVLRRDAIIELESLPPDEPLTVTHASSLRNKLLQLLSGAVYTRIDSPDDYVVLDTSRYELIAELINERRKTVVFFMYKHQQEELLKHLAKHHLNALTIRSNDSSLARGQIVQQFQTDPNIRAILLHPQTGAHGLTLTAATTTIWASPTAMPDAFIQGNHRIYRGSQTKETETILIQAADTLEKNIYDVLFGRNANMNDLLTMLRGY